MLTKEQIERIITDAMQSDDAVSLNVSPAHIAAEKIAELTKSDSTMLVAAQALENEVTSTLLHMAVATVLATLFEEEGGGRCNVAISPNSMNHMTKNYTYSVTMEGLTSHIAIQMREDSPLQTEEGWSKPSNRHAVALDENEDPTGALPQAEPKDYDRPIWAVRTSRYVREADEWHPVLLNCHDRADAERQCVTIANGHNGRTAHVENRYCLHVECPASGCTQSEATSEPVEG